MAPASARRSASRPALLLLAVFGAHLLSPLAGLATPPPPRAATAIEGQQTPTNSLWLPPNTDGHDLVRAPERQSPGRLPQRRGLRLTGHRGALTTRNASRSPARGPLRCTQPRIHLRDRGSRDPELPA